MTGRVEPLKVIAGAVVFVVERRARFAKALVVPLVLYCALDFAYLLRPGSIGQTLVQVAALFVQTVIAITTHRLLLLGDDAIPQWGMVRWGKREAYFFLYVFLVGFCAIPAALFAFIPVVGPVLTIVTAAWVLSRLSLVFPAIAVDEGVGLFLAWELTERHQLLMVTVVVLFPLALSLPALLFLLLPLPWSVLLISVLTAFVTVFSIAALSIAYREIRRVEYAVPLSD